MRIILFIAVLFGSVFIAPVLIPTKAHAISGVGCGTLCLAELRGYCPTCVGAVPAQAMTPWGVSPPYYWNTGPMMFGGFYGPAPWSYVPQPPAYYSAPVSYPSPGIIPGYFPGGGGFFAAKPNLYLLGAVGTDVSVKVKFVEEGANWLAAVPVHGEQGWRVTLAERNKLRSGDVTYGYLYSDYRAYGRVLQDQEGFCAPKEDIISKIALEMKRAGFSGRELADFMEYWSVKFPQSESYCVYPQDDRQLEKIASLEINPKPVAMRRVIFLVQVQEGLRKNGGKFTKAPKRPWNPVPLRVPAAESREIVAREWGVGFLAAKR